MKLPYGAHAVVDIAKLRDYCLSAEHPRGRHKARLCGRPWADCGQRLRRGQEISAERVAAVHVPSGNGGLATGTQNQRSVKRRLAGTRRGVRVVVGSSALPRQPSRISPPVGGQQQ